VERRVTPILSVSAGCIAVGVVLALSPPALQVGELPVKPAPIHETVIYPTVPIRIVKTASALQPPPVVKVRPEVPPVWKPVALPPVPDRMRDGPTRSATDRENRSADTGQILFGCFRSVTVNKNR
jgi:hypothetical protein